MQRTMPVRLIPFLFVALIITGCARTPPWYRIGEPGDVGAANEGVHVAYNPPSIIVAIATVSEPPLIFALFPLFYYIAKQGSITHANHTNNDALQALQDLGLDTFAQEALVAGLDPVFRKHLELRVRDSMLSPLASEDVYFKSRVNFYKRMTERLSPTQVEETLRTLPAHERLLLVDSWLDYGRLPPGILQQFGVEVSCVKADSVEPRIIWRERYQCQSRPLSHELFTSEPDELRQILESEIQVGIRTLMPWIERDLFATGPLGTKGARVHDITGHKAEGYLLEEMEDRVVMRFVDGGLLVVPRVYLKKVEEIDVERR